MNPLKDALTEAAGAVNTVFGAALGAYFGASIVNDKIDTTALLDVTTGLVGIALTVLSIQLIIRIDLIKNWKIFSLISILGGFFYIAGRRAFWQYDLRVVVLDAIIIAWLLGALLIKFWGRYYQYQAGKLK